MARPRVLFLCTHNSATSQIAEGFLRAIAGDRFDVSSAGTEATCVHPLAIRVMDEVGIDFAGHTSKTLDAVLGQPWDYVITLCDSANERCPVFLARTVRIHWSFDDPSQAAGTDEDRLGVFRRVRVTKSSPGFRCGSAIRRSPHRIKKGGENYGIAERRTLSLPRPELWV